MPAANKISFTHFTLYKWKDLLCSSWSMEPGTWGGGGWWGVQVTPETCRCKFVNSSELTLPCRGGQECLGCDGAIPSFTSHNLQANGPAAPLEGEPLSPIRWMFGQRKGKICGTLRTLPGTQRETPAIKREKHGLINTELTLSGREEERKPERSVPAHPNINSTRLMHAQSAHTLLCRIHAHAYKIFGKKNVKLSYMLLLSSIYSM